MRSLFEEALELVLAHQGGYAPPGDDPRGERYRGVARRVNPEWPGWARVDAAKAATGSLGELARALEADPLLQRDVEAHYRSLWIRQGYHRLGDQALASKMLDLAGEVGATLAHRLLQRALRAVHEPVVEDGSLGPATVAAANRAPGCCLLAALRSEAAGFARSLRDRTGEAERLRVAYDEG